jgi:hypothetical protein
MLDRIKHAPVKAAAFVVALLATLTTVSACSGASPGTPDPGAAGGIAGSALDRWIAWVTTKDGAIIFVGIILTAILVYFVRRIFKNTAFTIVFAFACGIALMVYAAKS